MIVGPVADDDNDDICGFRWLFVEFVYYICKIDELLLKVIPLFVLMLLLFACKDVGQISECIESTA